jgi:hypothetical protein
VIRPQINPAFVDLLRSSNLHGYAQIMQTLLDRPGKEYLAK